MLPRATRGSLTPVVAPAGQEQATSRGCVAGTAWLCIRVDKQWRLQGVGIHVERKAGRSPHNWLLVYFAEELLL